MGGRGGRLPERHNPTRRDVSDDEGKNPRGECNEESGESHDRGVDIQKLTDAAADSGDLLVGLGTIQSCHRKSSKLVIR